MKIAIYGDSFTVTHPRQANSWVQHLKILGYNIDNLGANGSSCYYSYKKFTYTHQEYDKIIFLATGYGRYWLKDNKFEPSQHVNGPDCAESFLNWPDITPGDQNRLRVLRDYMIHVQNTEQEQDFQDLMLREVKKIRPDTILIPCFDHNSSRVPNWEGPCLFDICKIDIQHFNLTRQQWTYPGSDLRHAHMNDDNNIIFANNLALTIESDSANFFINLNDYVKPTKDVTHYFTWPGQTNAFKDNLC